MNRNLLFYFLIAILVATASCGRRETRVEHGNREQILHIGNGTEPQDLDPHLVTGVTEHHIIMALLEGLVTEDPVDLHPVPGVAERWEISEDGKVYTFHLRTNAFWSNGDPVTARDFWESYKRILTPSLASEYAYMLHVVKNAGDFNKGKITDFNEVGFKVVDDHTFQITLESTTPYFLSLLNHTSWFPVHMPTVSKHGKPYERNNRWTRPGNFVGNGPFALSDWRVNHIVAVKKSTNYWDRDNVQLNEIRFYPLDNHDTEERAFRSGQLHLTEPPPPSKIAIYKNKHPDLIRIDPYLGVYFYRINVTKPPFNDKRVRRALAMSIDRKSIVENVTRGGQMAAFHFTPPGTAGYLAQARVTEDIAEAKKLLSEAGFPDGKGFPAFDLLFNSSEQHRAIAEAIQQMWKKNLGIEAKLLNQEWKVYLDAQRTLNYQLCRAAWIADYVDPNSFLDMWLTGGGNNDTGWSNAEFDRLIAEAGRTSDPVARTEIFQKAESILLDELPMIPVYFYTRVGLKRPEVQGFYRTILDHHPYKYIYLENNAPIERIKF